jgi:hypothetical protein
MAATCSGCNWVMVCQAAIGTVRVCGLKAAWLLVVAAHDHAFQLLPQKAACGRLTFDGVCSEGDASGRPECTSRAHGNSTNVLWDAVPAISKSVTSASLPVE